MSSPRSGAIYSLDLPNATATYVIVLTEDAWNDELADSVIVPLYASVNQNPSLFLVTIAPDLVANCTRVQSMPHEFIGEFVGYCEEERWTRARIGVRRFLDLDRRIAKTPAPPAKTSRADWWPRQNDIHFAANPSIGPDDKLYGVISDNDWNSQPHAHYAACVRLTSKSKTKRLRWEVPVTGGWVVTGDIYSISYERFDQKAPPKKYPGALSDDESSEIAVRQKVALSLR